MTMITPSYLGETIEYSSLHACRSTLEDPTAETATGPPPASDTPGFECYGLGLIDDTHTLYCEFAKKPTFDQSKAIVAAFGSMGAEPAYSHYREDSGTEHKSTGGEWVVNDAVTYPAVSLGCRPRTFARYRNVRFEFGGMEQVF